MFERKVDIVISKSLQELRTHFPLISSFLFDTRIKIVNQEDSSFIACITKSKLLGEEIREKYVLLINEKAIKNLQKTVMNKIKIIAMLKTIIIMNAMTVVVKMKRKIKI